MQKHKIDPITTEINITLDEIRRYYFNRTKHTLQVDDAKYLLERALDMGLGHDNGGVEALFDSLKYKFE